MHTERTSEDILSGVTAPITAELAQLLNFSMGGLYAAARRGDIPTVRIGNKVLVLCAPLRRMLQLDGQVESTKVAA